MENVRAGVNGVSLKDDLKAVNKESVLSDDNAIENSKAVEREYANAVTESATDIASRNVDYLKTQDTITKYQVARGGLQKQEKVLKQMESKLVEYSNESNPNLGAIDKEYKDMLSEIDRLSDNTTFAGEKLFEGGKGDTFQIPSVNLGGKSYLPLRDVDISTQEGLTNALATIQSAITKLSNEISICSSDINSMTDEMTSRDDFNYMDAAVIRETMKSLKNEIYTKGTQAIKAQTDPTAIL
ncbi:MAG: hypothetical protein MJ246_04815 [Clostridia bacterium]|nr:hypothetical protein [Clostridia bacterium]